MASGNLTDGDIPALVGGEETVAGNLLSLFPTSSVGSEMEGGDGTCEILSNLRKLATCGSLEMAGTSLQKKPMGK